MKKVQSADYEARLNCFGRCKILRCRVRRGHGKPGKSWNLSVSVFRPEMSWNSIVGHGTIIMCVVRKLLQVSKQGQNKIQASYVRKYIKDDFDNFRKRKVNVRSWKTGKSLGKGHGKSWNLKTQKSANPPLREERGRGTESKAAQSKSAKF